MGPIDGMGSLEKTPMHPQPGIEPRFFNGLARNLTAISSRKLIDYEIHSQRTGLIKHLRTLHKCRRYTNCLLWEGGTKEARLEKNGKILKLVLDENSISKVQRRGQCEINRSAYNPVRLVSSCH